MDAKLEKRVIVAEIDRGKPNERGTAVSLLSRMEYEHLIPMKEVPRFLPPAAKKPCYDTILQWTKRGVRGVVLETLWIGGRKFTSEEAIVRFFDAITLTREGHCLPVGYDPKELREQKNRVLRLIDREPQ